MERFRFIPRRLLQAIPVVFGVTVIVFFLIHLLPGDPAQAAMGEHATPAGFTITRRQSLRFHYARTLDHWAEALESHRDEAIAVQSEEVYERYMRYLTGCANGFRVGYIDVNQFTMTK